jgi:hypothetical protein
MEVPATGEITLNIFEAKFEVEQRPEG